MTGEITLRGRVLQIGGFREKVLAAHRHGIRRVIAPQEHARDLSKLPPTVRKEMEFIFASTMYQVIAAALRLEDTVVEGYVGQIEPLAGNALPDAVAAAQLQAQRGDDAAGAQG